MKFNLGIKNALDIQHNLKRFAVIDPYSIPTTVEELNRFGDKGIKSLENLYGNDLMKILHSLIQMHCFLNTKLIKCSI